MAVREEAMTAKAFQERLDFMTQRFTQEVESLREMYSAVLERLPVVRVERNINE